MEMEMEKLKEWEHMNLNTNKQMRQEEWNSKGQLIVVFYFRKWSPIQHTVFVWGNPLSLPHFHFDPFSLLNCLFSDQTCVRQDLHKWWGPLTWSGQKVMYFTIYNLFWAPTIFF